MEEQMGLPGPDSQGDGWRDDAPVMTGWYRTRRHGQPPTRHEQRRFFDGRWSEPVLVGFDDDVEAVVSASTPAPDQLGIQWMGLDRPHPSGYGYALVLLGEHSIVPLDVAIHNLRARLP